VSAAPEEEEAAGEKDEISFSRVVRAAVGQIVEVPFRGAGWVYLGEIGSRRGMVYDSRRLDEEGLSFLFRAETPGTYGLKFYKQDFIRDYSLIDHVQVIVDEAGEPARAGYFNPPVDRARVAAEPRWPPAPGEAPGSLNVAQNAQNASQNAQNAPQVAQNTPQNAQNAPQNIQNTPQNAQNVPPNAQNAPQNAQNAPQNAQNTPQVAQNTPQNAQNAPQNEQNTPQNAQNAPQNAQNAPQNYQAEQALSNAAPANAEGAFTTPGSYLSRAREEYNGGRFVNALSILDQYRERYPGGSDEAWWLYGQTLEANGPQRDIRASLAYYRRLIEEFPQSPRCTEASRRIAYMQRHYFTIQ
jgi:hypothetical protein